MTKSKTQWSDYQTAIFKEVETTDNHLVVRACAGSGKSTVLFETIQRLSTQNKTSSILFLAFNKSIETYATEKLENCHNVVCQTFHGHGISVIKKTFKKAPRMQPNKIMELLRSEYKLGDRFGQYFFIVSKIRNLGILEKDPKKLAKLLKSNWESLLKFGSTEEDAEYMKQHIKIVCHILSELDKDLGHMDFDDMCRFPVLFNLFSRLYDGDVPDILLVDEVQDLNPVQISFIRLYLKRNPNMRVIAVGDDRQAIYGFRGAINSMNRVIKGLNAKVMPLNITYRTRSNIVDWINAKCEHSDMEAHKDSGKVIEVEGEEENPYCIDTMLAHDVTMIISPKNKHIIKVALLLMERDILVSMKGSQIIPVLKKMIKAIGTTSFTLFRSKLIEIKNKKKRKAKASENSDTAEALLEVIDYFDIQSVSGLVSTLEGIQKRDKGRGIVMHSAHSSKGLESPVVAVINDFFKMEDEQEENLKYVAFSRAEDKLLVIDPWLKKKSSK